jgi:thiamine pyrophosphokinase
MRICCAVDLTGILLISSTCIFLQSSGLVPRKQLRRLSATQNMSNNKSSSSDHNSAANAAVLVHKSPFLENDNDGNDTQTALVILNTPIRQPPSPLFATLWSKSHYRVCADGGANRLYHSTAASDSLARNTYIPHLITGDLDSLQPLVGDYYQSAGCSVVRDPDQDCNDLDKALMAVSKHKNSKSGNGSGIGRVLVYGAFGGRFDQEMGCIQALYKWSHKFNHCMWLYDDLTVCWLLPADRMNHIQLPRFDSTILNSLGEGPTCGLIPVGGAVDSVTTTGFKWDLHQDATAFGGLVSTSNRVMAETVTVTSSHPLVFTAEVFSGIPEQEE